MPRAEGPAGDLPALLVGIANPETVPSLMELAGCVASHAGYRVVATHILTVPPQTSLGAARGSREIAAAKQIMRSAVSAGADKSLRTRAVVVVAREVHEGLICAASTQRAELILVGYSDTEGTPDAAEKRFDRIMHRVARGAGSDLVVAKFRREAVSSVLVPIATGTSLRVSGLLAQALAAVRGAEVRFMHVVEKSADRGEREARIAGLLAEHDLQEAGELEIVTGDDVLAAILDCATEHDLLIVGADPRPSLAESTFGGLAERIASQAEATVLLVRAK